MNFIIENWYIILGILAVLAVAGYAIYKFAGLPTKEQIAKIKQYLLYAVIEAEKELGNKTGKAKLLFAYDLMISKFPVVAKLISFETFSKWIDEALVEMEKLLKENEALALYVKNGNKSIQLN